MKNLESLDVAELKDISLNTDEESLLVSSEREQDRKATHKAAILGFTITAVFAGALGLLSFMLNSKKKSKPHAKPTSTPSPTPSVTPSITATPSVTNSVTPSSSSSVTPSASKSVTPSVSPSRTPSISNTPSKTPSPSRTPSHSITPTRTPSPSTSPSSAPGVLGKATYTFKVLQTYEHQVCIKNNDQTNSLSVAQMSFTVNEPIVWGSGELAPFYTPHNYTQNADQNYTSNFYPQPPVAISAMQMKCVQYQVRNYEPDYGNSTYFASNVVPMNPTVVAVNNQAIPLDGIVPFNPEAVSRIKPGVRYDGFDLYYTDNTATNISFDNTRIVVYDGGVTYDSQTLKFYLFDFPAMDFHLPEIAVNKIQYNGSYESYLTIEALDDVSADPCVFNNFDLPLLNQTSQTLLIQNMLTATQVWQLNGVNIDFTEPCTNGSQFIAPFIEQLGATFATAGKKVMVHLPGNLTRAQQLPTNVTCAIARSVNYISIIGVYVDQAWQGTQVVTADQAPLNQLETSINYYQSLNCINSEEQLGVLQLAEANSWFVSSLINNGKNQPIQGIPRGQYDISPEEAAAYNITEENTGLAKWNCVSNSSQCGEYNPVPADIIFIQGENQSGLWGYSPTLQNTTNGTYYYVMSGPDPVAAIRDANLAIQKGMSFVMVAPSGADVPNGSQSLFFNIYQTLNNASANQTANNSYANTYFVNNTEQTMPYQIPAHVVASIENILKQLPREALTSIGQGIVGYVTHKVTGYEFKKLLQSYGFADEHIYWMHYGFSRAISLGLTTYYTGDFVAALGTTLNLTVADLYLKYIVGLSAETTSYVTSGLTLGAQALNSLPATVNAALGIGASILIGTVAPVVEEVAAATFNKCANTFSYVTSKVGTMFKAASHFVATQPTAEVTHQTSLTV